MIVFASSVEHSTRVHLQCSGFSQRTAGKGAGSARPIHARRRAPLHVEIDSLAPRGEAKAP